MVKKGKGSLSKIKPKESELVVSGRFYSGPIPPASELAKYAEIDKGLIKWITTQSKELQKHQIEVDKKLVDNHLKRSGRGQMFAFCLGVLGILASVVIAYLGYPTQAVVFGSGTIVALVTVFLVGKARQKNSENKKKP